MASNHTLTAATPDLTTLLTTDRDSYVYTCPVCDLSARYAIPTAPEVIYCDGLDFGTKIPVGENLLEVSDVLAIKQNFSTNDTIDTPIDTLITAGLVEQQDVDLYALTELGLAARAA